MKECPTCLSCQEDDVSVCLIDGTTLVPDLPGRTLLDGKYKLERRLGLGGMGVVYKARHLDLDRSCALKLLRFHKAADSQFLARFRLEAKALGRLKHPNIVEVMDFGIDPRGDGVPYLVMEYLEGRSLESHCGEAGPLPLGEALPIFDSIARAIDYAHEHGILHRDLKPANILLCSNEAPASAVKILDFGLARLLEDVGLRTTAQELQSEAGTPATGFPGRIGSVTIEQAETLTLTTVDTKAQPMSRIDGSRLTEAGSIFGTLPYLAPELLRGIDAVAASDNYAFGVLIFEVLVGRPPFVGSAADVMAGHLKDSPFMPAAASRSLPEEVRAAMLVPLEKDPARRPKSAADVVAQIRSAAVRAEARNWRAREIPRRLKFSALLGALLTGLSALLWRTGLVERLEAKTVGARFQAAVSHEPDHRILLLTVDESSLAADRTPLAQRADEFGGLLERVFGAGARAVAIDFLLPETWSQSEIFSRFVLNHAPALTLAAFSPPVGKVVGPECINGLTAAALGPERAAELFGMVNLEEDRDGMTRTARFSYDDRQGFQRPTWAARAVETMRAENPDRPSISPDRSRQRFWIDYAVDWTRFQRISWEELDREVDRDPRVFRDRLVIVGGDFVASGDEAHPVPHLGGASPKVSGLVLQALIANTMFARLPIHNAGVVPVLLGVWLASTFVGAAFLCLRNVSGSVGILVGIVATHLTVALVDFRQSGVVVPVTGPVMTLGVVALLGLGLRRKLASFPDLYREAG